MDFDQPQPQDTGTSLFQLSLDANNSYTLRSAASWAKVLGVVGIMVGGVILAWCVNMMIKLSQVSSYGYYRRSEMDLFSNSDTGSTKLGVWVFIISGIIFIVGGIFSLGFGNKISAALKTNSQDGLNGAFAALRNYYALRAITLIIVLLMFIMVFAATL